MKRFEKEFPEEAATLMKICVDRLKKRGKQKPLFLDLVEPIIKNQPKYGRNSPCACGSGLKAKKCCGVK
jgi:uncharacterized protein YecA (UPF0149 family)